MLRKLLIASLAIAYSLPSSAAIFGSDDRISVPFGQGELAPIGMVFGRKYPTGTGTLVSPCHVLTAHHSVSFDKDVVGKRVTFKVANSESKGVVVKAGSFEEKGRYQYAPDWALVKLDRCLGNELGWIPVVSNTEAGGKYLDAGIPYDRPNTMLTVDPACTVMAYSVNFSAMETDCATLPGNSGGPVLHRRPDGNLELAGITIAGDNFFQPFVGGKPDHRYMSLNGQSNIAIPLWRIWDYIAPTIAADGGRPIVWKSPLFAGE